MAGAAPISDLLDISRIVTGKLRLDIEEVDLASVLGDAIDTVQQDADEKRIVINRDLNTNVGTIAGDAARAANRLEPALECHQIYA